MARYFKDQYVVSSTAPDNAIIISTDHDDGKELFRFDSNLMNVTNSIGHKIHLSFSRSTGELTIREVLSDLAIQTQRAVSGHLTLIGGSFDVNQFRISLAKGGLEAFFIHITLRDMCRLGKDDLSFDTAHWDHTVRQQLRLHKHKTTLKSIKALKIWIVNPSGNTSFDASFVRGAFERGGALPMKSAAIPRFRGYKDPDAVTNDNCAPSLNYENDPISATQKQPLWLEVDFEAGTRKNPGLFIQPQGDSAATFEATLNENETSVAELGAQLRIRTVEKDTAEAKIISLEAVNKRHVATIRRAKNRILQLEQLVQARELLIHDYNTEHIVHYQTDTSALAIELARLKSISPGDCPGLAANFSSMRIGRPTIERLLKNSVFTVDFLEPSKKRDLNHTQTVEDDSSDHDDMGNGAKRTRMK